MKEVLYVEDSVMSQRVMQRFLIGLCNLKMCNDLLSAEKLLKENHFDLLITDFLFPEGDAMTLIRGVRRKHSPTELPIIAVSSGMDELLMSGLGRAGVNESFGKPLNPAEIRTCVERMLESPYVKPIEGAAVGVRCFGWEADGLFHQFSPELNRTISGPTKETVSEHMKAALQERLEQGKMVGVSYHEGILTHVIKPRA